MTFKHLQGVMRLYGDRIRAMGIGACPNPGNPLALHHLQYMCNTVGTWNASRTEKAMRWLGFVQAGLISHAMYTLEDVKEHSKP